MRKARSARILEFLQKAEHCAALAEETEKENLQLRTLYSDLAGQWRSMAEQAEYLEKMARELEAERARLDAAQRRFAKR